MRMEQAVFVRRSLRDSVSKAETIGLDSEFLRLRDDRETGRGSDMADSGTFRA